MTRWTLPWTLLMAISALPGIARADLESLEPETAFAEVSSSTGVVLVDLFAEW